MKLRPGIFLALSVGLPTAAAAQIDNYTPYHELLARECRARHLEWLSPAALEWVITKFDAALPKSAKTELNSVNDEKTVCSDVSEGLTCGNVSYLRALNKIGLLAKFAKSTCETGFACRGQSDCTGPQL